MNKKLRVFAELIEENSIQYRLKTILKYGDSWDLIGTIVMKNPGSASPRNIISQEDFNNIKEYIYPNVEIENWHEFNDDNTIKRISNIFDGTFLNKKSELNGIILIYNLFNIRENLIIEAVKKANLSNSEYLFPNLDELLTSSQNKPIYLGFNWEYTNKINKHHPKIEKFANDLFTYIKHSEYMYLEDEIINNFFYHPLSSQFSSLKYQHILEKFYEKVLKSTVKEFKN